MIWGYVVALVTLGLDQLTKFLIYGTASRSIIGNLLWFESALNTGVAFSMFEGKGYIFIINSLIASAIFIFLIASKKFTPSKFEKIVFGLILGGTVGNVIDRIAFGGVRDFISLRFMNFAIFNVADMGITIGAVLLCVYILLSMFKPDKAGKNTTVKENDND